MDINDSWAAICSDDSPVPEGESKGVDCPIDDVIQYNARFVGHRPGAPYNSNNKSVRTIKQNSFKPLLECICVCNVM